MLNRSDLQLTELASIGAGQVLQEVLHVLLGQLLQVDQVGEGVELLQPLLRLLRHLRGLDLSSRMEAEKDGVEDVGVDQGGVGPWVGVHLLHLVLWGGDSGLRT